MLVLNTTLFHFHSKSHIHDAAHDELHELYLQQDSWFDEEIENAKLSANQVNVVGYHSWFIHHKDEPDSEFNVPLAVRSKWLQKMRHSKVSVAFCTNATSLQEKVGGFCFAKPKGKSKKASSADEEESYSMSDFTSGGEPMKPSEIIARSKALGENLSGSDSDGDIPNAETSAKKDYVSDEEEEEEKAKDSDSDNDEHDVSNQLYLLEFLCVIHIFNVENFIFYPRLLGLLERGQHIRRSRSCP